MNNLRLCKRRARPGFALLLVLGVLVLMSALVVGFMTRAQTENSSSAAYKASVSARILGDMVTSLVQGQINMATTQGYNVAWASQPGLVRTFDDSGNTLNAFKLYSAPDMIVSSGSFEASVKNDSPATAEVWTGNSALWTDLNAPVRSASGAYSYPILDTGSAQGETPALSAAPEGFAVSQGPVNDALQPAPMPVRWLYVLRDGSVVSPTAGTGTNSAHVQGEVSGTNPIVGRIAFWADDDTCKVNINTASEGAYWDTPRGNAFSERALAYWQPTLGEYQRYPGHPAMTCLSSVLYPGTVQPPNFAPASSYDARNNYMPQDDCENAYKVTPRIASGGSVVGTKDIYSAAAVTTDVDRLFANINELIFNPGRQNTYGGLSLTKDAIEQTKFFLTAHSRAPELNLFNLPRIACWPVYALNNGAYDTSRTTPFDQLIGMCSSIGGASGNGSGSPYFFQRKDSKSATELTDINRNSELYSYLDWLTSQRIPGYGHSFAEKYPQDQPQILTEIFDYIRSTNLADDIVVTPFTTPFNGIGGVPPGHGLVVPTHYNNTMGFGRFFTLTEFGIGFICNAAADDPSTPDINEAAGSNDAETNSVLGGNLLKNGEKKVQAIIIMNFYSPMLGWTSAGPEFTVEISGLEKARINGQNMGFPASGSTVFNQDPSMLYVSRSWGGYPGWRYIYCNKRAPQIPVSETSPAIPADPADGNTPAGEFPFISAPVTITPNKANNPATMSFSGPTANSDLTVQVKIYAGASASGTPVQTFDITLPGGTFPVPNLVDAGTKNSSGTETSTKENWWALSRKGFVSGKNGRLKFIKDSPGQGSYVREKPDSGAFFRSDKDYDVVRTVSPAYGGNFGDYRLVAASAVTGSAVFQPRPEYHNSSLFMYSTLPEGLLGYHGAAGWDRKGSYVAGKTCEDPTGYSWWHSPSIPAGVTGPTLTGDFDVGLPMSPDGPYINKPDEGNLGTTNTSYGYNAIPYYLTAKYQFVPGKTFFTPNRMMPSPGMFGSLPTGVKAGIPWKTLLLRPQPNHPAYINPTAPGNGIPDHLLLDLFWMPVVQPYAISDRFSTAGKINMNYQILPFTYINRSTGMRALLKSERIAAIRSADLKKYNSYGPGTNGKPQAGDTGFADNGSAQSDFRRLIDADATLAQFDSKFANLGAFRSASEICDLFMVPSGLNQTAATMENYWKNEWAATPDNMRERVYTTLYPRLTTKSNTFTIHFRVQTLKKVKGADADETWTESKNVVTGEYRGSTTIERFIDPNNTSIPDYAANPSGIPLLGEERKTPDYYYKWRVVESRQFTP